jgi:hypothetical protein
VPSDFAPHLVLMNTEGRDNPLKDLELHIAVAFELHRAELLMFVERQVSF